MRLWLFEFQFQVPFLSLPCLPVSFPYPFQLQSAVNAKKTRVESLRLWSRRSTSGLAHSLSLC